MLLQMIDRGIDEMSSTDGGEYGKWRNYRLYGDKLRFILQVGAIFRPREGELRGWMVAAGPGPGGLHGGHRAEV